MVPRDELVVGVEAGLDVVRRHRPEFAERHVILARPDVFHRLSGGLGETHGVEYRLVIAAPAKPATEELLVQHELRAFGIEDFRHTLEQAGRRLRTGPDFGGLAVGADPGRGVHRLHLRVIDVARAVFAAEHALRARQRRIGVAVLFIRHARAVLVAADGGEIAERLLAVEMSAGRVTPGNAQQPLGGERGLDGRGDDADALGQLHDADDVCHLAGAGIVDFKRRAARIGRLQHRGVDHAGHLHIHAVFGCADDFERQLDARHVFADETKICRRLEIAFRNLRQFGRCLGEHGDLAIADAPSRRLVNDDARLGRELARRHVPLRRHRLDQHAAHLRAGDAQRGEIAVHRRAGGRLERVAIGRVAVFLVVPIGREHRPHLRPVRIQLFGDDQRQGGERALAHFGRRRHDGDRAVGRDRQPDARLVGRCLRLVGERIVDDRKRIGRDGQRESEAGGLQQMAAVECGSDMFGHDSALPRCAFDGADDAQIGAAAADVAVHVLDDLVRASVSCCRQATWRPA